MISRAMARLFAGAGVVVAACNKDLLVDDFSTTNINSLGSWTSDDGSMTSVSASGGKLTMTPGTGYYYQTFPCQAASDDGYSGVQFDASGPAGSSMTVEVQTKSSCDASSHISHYYTLSVTSASTITYKIPFPSWSGANANAVSAVVWEDFSKSEAEYVIDNIKFTCKNSGGSSTPDPTQAQSSTKTVDPVPTSTATEDPAHACEKLLIDDWISQSRLTFLYYNAMIEPSSDDGTMSSLVVNNNRLVMTPSSTSSYFYSVIPCVDALEKYGGISLRVKAPAGATMDVQLTTLSSCTGGTESYHYVSSSDLGWAFNGQEQLYNIDFAKFDGMTPDHLQNVLFTNMNQPVTVGPMVFYCGDTPSEYITTPREVDEPETTEPAPASTASAIVIDTFGQSEGSNDLGFWRGYDSGLSVSYSSSGATIVSSSADYSFYTKLSASCKDLSGWADSYLHVRYSGSSKFTIALQQHNTACDEKIAPFPETWDSLEAKRYAQGSDTDIYIPIDHFNVKLNRVIGFAFKGFYTTEQTILSKVEIVKSVPSGWKVPTKLPSGNLMFACKRPNSFAFAIDDGVPNLAQEVMKIIQEENIKVTFFTVGAPLLDKANNLSTVYTEMLRRGHQVALHSYTHPPMEGLPDEGSIDWEYTMDIQATEATLADAGFSEHSTSYFRPPFGTEGARMRQRLCAVTGDSEAYIVNWSVDVEDWLWAMTDTPEKQLEAFQRDVDKGGNLVVLHYLYPSTVQYLREFIQIAKATGKDLMRVDQCMEDPNAPPL